MIVRAATPEDASAMAELLNAIIKTGGTTAWMSVFDGKRITETFITIPLLVSCFVAVDKRGILGFQQVEWCDPNYPGKQPLPADWGLISTFVGCAARGLGVGRALFKETLPAAQKAGVTTIDATIRADNTLGLAYYGALGFVDFDLLSNVPLDDGSKVDRIRKRFDLSGTAL